MALFQWTEELSVGVKRFDDDHQRLFEMINDLNDAMLRGKGREALNDIITGLEEYAKTHFSAEEKLFAEYEYPFAQSHKKQHDFYIGKVAEFKRENDEGRLGVTVKVSQFLSDWLKNHIKVVDKQYTQFFNERGVR